MSKRKTLADFEKLHGGPKIAALEGALKAQAESRHKIHLEIPCADNSLVFGVMGDTHYGSLYEAKDECAAFYDRCKAEGVTDVLHAGDVIDGHKMYRGQEFELHAHGWAAQRDWFAKTAPRVDGIKTHFITGNHDASMKKAAGIDVGGELTDRRPDWHMIGEDHGTVRFSTPNGRRFRVMLLHPGAGSSYAVSYRPQKITEQIEGGTKPNMLLIGNYHKAEWMPSYRNVSVIQVGCFHGVAHVQTPDGPVAMWHLKRGDYVLTHANRFMPIDDVLTRKYRGEWVLLRFGRRGSVERFASTADHPVLSSKHGESEVVYREARNVAAGDTVFVRAVPCRVCGVAIPYWSNICRRCNPMNLEHVRAAACLARQGKPVGPEGFVGVEVLENEASVRDDCLVYNLEVAEDHSYVCQNVVVHNCFQWQTPFMITKGLAAHVGGWIVRVTVQEDRAMSNSVRAEFVAFYSATA